MKIALVCVSLNELGGKNNHMKNIYRHFLQRGDCVHIICCSKVEEDLRRFMEDGGVRREDLIFLSRRKKWFVLPFMLDLLRLFRRNQYDIVQLFQLEADALAAWPARLAGARRIFSYYESTPIPENISVFKKWFYRLMNIFVKDMITATIAVSGGVAGEVHSVLSRPPEKIPVNYLGIRIPDAVRSRSCSTARLEAGRPVIGTIGRFSHEKALERIIRIMPEVKRAFPAARCLLVGRGPREEELKGLSRELHVHEQVEFRPWTEDVFKTLEEIDVFLMPSRREGCPTALLEAMAARRPVLASGIDGINEIVTDGDNGFLVNTEDEAAFARAVVSLCRSPERAAAVGEEGFRTVEARFTMRHEMDRLEKLYGAAAVREAGRNAQ